MGIFSRRREARAEQAEHRRAEAITAFWAWWEHARPGIESAMDAGDLGGLVDELTARVRAIGEDLAWELGGSADSRTLVVTAEGDPDARALARRWLLAAPAAGTLGHGGTWVFTNMRLPDEGDWVLQVGDHPVGASDLRFAIAEHGAGLDVAVWHPVFAGLPEEDRAQIAFLALDAALGEADVELWLDDIDAPAADPGAAATIDDLRAAVATARARAYQDGQLTWRVLEERTPDGSRIVRCLVRLSPVLAPQFELHVAITAPYRDFDAVTAFEEHLVEGLEGSGMHVASTTDARERVIHLYVDPAASALDRLRIAAATWDQGSGRVETERDPAWHGVAAFR